MDYAYETVQKFPDRTRYITTDVSHLGMSINRRVMELVLQELTRERKAQ